MQQKQAINPMRWLIYISILAAVFILVRGVDINNYDSTRKIKRALNLSQLQKPAQDDLGDIPEFTGPVQKKYTWEYKDIFYTPGVGMIKQVSYKQTNSGPKVKNEEYELIFYDLN